MTTGGRAAGARLPALPSLDRASSVPVHGQIASWLRDAVATGRLSPGDRLPGERVLAAELDVSRMTLRQALAELESTGALERVPGRGGGAFVTAPQVDVDLTELVGLTAQLERDHRRPGARVLRAYRTTAQAVDAAAALALRPRSAVVVLERLRSAGGLPLAVEHSVLPARLVPGILDRRLTGSLYALLVRTYGLRPHHAVERLEPVAADDAVAALLGIEAGTPVMRVHRVARTADGTPVEHAVDVFRPDHVRFLVHRSPAASTASARLP